MQLKSIEIVIAIGKNTIVGISVSLQNYSDHSNGYQFGSSPMLQSKWMFKC